MSICRDDQGAVIVCAGCHGVDLVKDGKAGGGRQRYICRRAGCGKRAGLSIKKLVKVEATRRLREAAQKLRRQAVPVAVISEALGIPMRTIHADRQRQEAVD